MRASNPRAPLLISFATTHNWLHAISVAAVINKVKWYGVHPTQSYESKTMYSHVPLLIYVTLLVTAWESLEIGRAHV